MKFERKPNSKTLLFLGGPGDAVPAMAKAWALGYKLIVVDNNYNAPGLIWTITINEAWSAIASAYDTSGIIEFFNHSVIKIDGVLAVATDVGPVVSQVTEYLNLPHIPYEITKLGWDKRALKEKLHSHGIPVAATADFVIKPNYQGRGARGVSVMSASDLRPTYEHQQAQQYSDDVLYEQFIHGPQISAEAIVWDSKIVFCGYTDRNYSNGYPVEIGGSGPSKYSDTPFEKSLDWITDKTVEALGIKAGTIKFDIVMDKHRNMIPTIIEMAIGRLSGGLMCSHYLPLAYGVNFLEMAFDVACGVEPELKHSKRRYNVTGFYSNKDASIHKERGRFKMTLERI